MMQGDRRSRSTRSEPQASEGRNPSASDQRARRPGNGVRACGECSLCCTVLRVDELAKLGGTPCRHQRGGGGCGIYEERPGICRAYRCLWLGGGLRDGDRPDGLGAVLDVVSTGGSVWLEIREAAPGAFARSPRLQEIAAEYRRSMPVRIGDTADVLDADRRFRVLLPDGEERIVAGEYTTRIRPGQPDTTVRLPRLERWLRRVSLAFRRRRVAGYDGAR